MEGPWSVAVVIVLVLVHGGQQNLPSNWAVGTLPGTRPFERLPGPAGQDGLLRGLAVGL